MERLSGNRRLVYEYLRRIGGGRVSMGTLACICGCHYNTVRNAVQYMAARGLIRYEDECGRPHRYELT